MKSVILAAGISSRLRPLTDSTPKCLLQVGKYSILERTMLNLQPHVDEFIIVTGHLADQIQNAVRSSFPNISIQFVRNREFASTDDAYSLWLTKGLAQHSDLLLLDSDMVFDKRIVELVLQSHHKNALAVRTAGQFDKEEVQVIVDQGKKILQIGKNISLQHSSSESIGIEKFSSFTVDNLFEVLERRICKENRVNEFYESSFQELIDRGTVIYGIDVGVYPCKEIDTPEDLELARREIVPLLDKGMSISSYSETYDYQQSIKSELSDELINTYLFRPLAGLMVKLLYPTSITPNHLTIAAIGVGLCAAFGYSFNTPTATFIAGLLITLKDLLDSADGQLARAKQMYSRCGRFLDSIGDFVVDLCVFTAITIALFQTYRQGHIIVLGILGLAGITLRVSYHVFYQVSYLHLEDRYLTNRIIEEITDADRMGDPVALRLQQIFIFIYGWQDRLMYRIDQWCKGDVDTLLYDEQREFDRVWYFDKLALRLSGFSGFGTEFALLTICSMANQLYLYLLLNCFLMNSLWLATIFYRKFYLAKHL